MLPAPYVQAGQRLTQAGNLSGATTEHKELRADLTGRQLRENIQAYLEKQRAGEQTPVVLPSAVRQASTTIPFDTGALAIS